MVTSHTEIDMRNSTGTVMKHGERVSWRGQQEATVMLLAGEWSLPDQPTPQCDAIIRTDDGILRDVSELEIWELM